MNDLTILVGMLSAPAFLFIAWVMLIEFNDYIRQWNVRAYVQSHTELKQPVHR